MQWHKEGQLRNQIPKITLLTRLRSILERYVSICSLHFFIERLMDVPGGNAQIYWRSLLVTCMDASLAASGVVDSRVVCP